MNRREFLQVQWRCSSALSVRVFHRWRLLTAQQRPKPAFPGELDSWIAIVPDGGVTAFFGKMDMGQALDVAVAQIVADELDVGFDKVEVADGRHRDSRATRAARPAAPASRTARSRCAAPRPKRAALLVRERIAEAGRARLDSCACDDGDGHCVSTRRRSRPTQS